MMGIATTFKNSMLKKSHYLGLVIIAFSIATHATVITSPVKTDVQSQQLYKQTFAAINKGHKTRSQEGMKQLQNYPLYPYLVKGEAGAGLIKVLMNGRHDVRRVDIDPSLMTEDKEVLEDLIAAAVNDAVRKVENSNQEAMSGLAGGMDLSKFKMPF